MKLRCPQCDGGCGLFDRECATCGLALTVGSLLRFYVAHVRRTVAVRCARCGRGAVPVGATTCPVCGERPTFQDAVQATVEPHRRRVRQFLSHASPRTRNWVQWFYLLFSAGLLWELQTVVAERTDWIGASLLTVLYLSVFLLAATWFIPRRVFQAIAQRASAKVKLGLVLNFFSAMLLLQLVIAAWWARAVVQAGTFVMLWGAAVLFNRFILPVAASTRATLLGDDDSYDPTSPQGRTVRLD